ncbi:hypothetical protein BUALT_Bualt08G0062200 [Buddleja alternifolia]|uniref:Uncharacterized protein n=1 Tax=Buddleja alternifolia TaxID=168488 RepID=A0AAV6X4K7_9LAMI|nr:hypothetical protein BUALT_Bualt08G0062200 [Buddleja alternifolia]
MMKPLKLSYCPVERKPCIRWIQDLFKDCLCNLKDEISFAFGIAGLVCWAVAEIPQIITNFKNKSANGVSLAFISTWIIGDVFNLVGCILEPATLPTQFYTALVEDENEPIEPKLQDRRKKTTNAPVEVPQRRDFYFMSARSMAGSDSSPAQCYLKARSGPPVLEHHTDSSSDEDEDESLLPLLYNKPLTQPRSIPRAVRYGTFVAASANLPHLSRAIIMAHGAELSGRRLLQEQKFQENAYGQWLGWLMAAIYMGGRIPQIWLNIKRGSVEGLNPLMFVFALIANATYVGSILVRNTEWEMIKANMPWLLDAAVCVVLDLFIIVQYIFYKYMKIKNKSEHCGEYYGDYVEAEKPITN